MEPRRKIKLSDPELRLLAEALDSHAYWQVSYPTERRDGTIIEPPSPGTHEFGEGTRTEQQHWHRLHDCFRLRARLIAITPEED